MLSEILFVALVVVVSLLTAVDVSRTRTDSLGEAADHRAHDTERVLAAGRSGAGTHAFARETARREDPVPAASTRTAVAPVEAEPIFERPNQSTRAFGQTRHEMGQPATDAALRGKLNAMFVNLSRRSQNLVERQLRLIESLEHGEQDEQRLASLSKLNRVAMRIHRNSQNLLILAGNESASGWNQPVTLTYLVEAAVGEVEDYERVSFEVQPDIAVRGSAVHDLVHLLVELVDNATSFSAAEMPVDVKGYILSSGGALVDITDRGIGMAANEMAYANQQLDNPPPPDVDVPKWMGLLVVARLAARHGIRVRLNQADVGGLTAMVWLPDEILTHVAVPAGPGYATAAPRRAAAGPPGPAPVRMPAHEAPLTRADPAWSVRGMQTVVQAEPSADVGVVVPQAESRPRTRGLPIFDEVESHWPKGSHEASGPAASGLPRRSAASAQGSRAASRPPSAASNQGGAGQGWGAPAGEAKPASPDES